MTLFGIRVFADVIKVKIWIRSHGIRVDPKSNESILIKDGQGHREAQRMLCDCGAEPAGRRAPQKRPKEARKEAWNGFSLRASGRNRPR